MGVRNCFSCGKGFGGSTRDLLLKYKEDFKTKGIIRYFYKTETNGQIKIVRNDSFKKIFETDIKPNFKKGAEYARIDEYEPV